MKKYYLGLVLVGFCSLVQGNENDSVFTWDMIDIASKIRNKCENCVSLDCKIIEDMLAFSYRDKCRIQEMRGLINQINSTHDGEHVRELQEKLRICEQDGFVISETVNVLNSYFWLAVKSSLGYHLISTMEEEEHFADLIGKECNIIDTCVGNGFTSLDQIDEMKRQVEMALAKK